ncbi:MAG: TetR/AcrR family transcriptional regulator [Verrucomicrobia bacterium]|nr:TetR/AcrR family transcriptional regulator [Verrucomicrobiota bacterium]
MTKIKEDKRSRLIQAAMKLTHQYGFRTTALADIAKEARIPLGNIYYYFKTKDDVANAIIHQRVSRLRRLLQKLDKTDSPTERLCGFVQIKINDRELLARNGCPAGTLCSELHKHGGPVARNATALFTEALAWLEAQFKALGKGRDSRGLAIHLLSTTQGVSLLAHTFHDPSLISIEAARLKKWIRAL